MKVDFFSAEGPKAADAVLGVDANQKLEFVSGEGSKPAENHKLEVFSGEAPKNADAALGESLDVFGSNAKISFGAGDKEVSVGEDLPGGDPFGVQQVIAKTEIDLAAKEANGLAEPQALRDPQGKNAGELDIGSEFKVEIEGFVEKDLGAFDEPASPFSKDLFEPDSGLDNFASKGDGFASKDDDAGLLDLD